jgi:hypothetical protein
MPPLVALFMSMGIAEPARSEIRVQGPGVRSASFALWRHRAVLIPLLIGKVMIGLAYGAVLTWTAPALSRRFALAPDRIGAIMATVLMISGILGPLVGGLLADFCQRSGGPRRTATALSILALSSVPVGFFALMPQIGPTLGMLIAFMAIVPVLAVMVMTVTTVVMPVELRGLSLSVMIAMGLAFGLGLAPVSVSMLSSALGGPAMLSASLAVICAMSSFVASVIFLVSRRYFGRVASV